MTKNCLEIVRPFVDETAGNPLVQMIGGVGSFVLSKRDVEIKPDEKLIVAGPDIDFDQLGAYRAEGSKRDMDVLVLSTEADKIDEITDVAQQTIGDQLAISVFGIRKISELQRQNRHKWFSLATVWLSDRYAPETVAEPAQELPPVDKALYPFAVRMEPETLETWQLIIDNDLEKPIPVPHPGTVVLNYLTRSISGLRPKDEQKVQSLAGNIFAKSPVVADWIVDGPGQSQVELARLLHSLRSEPERHPIKIGGKLEIAPIEDNQIVRHPALMYGDKTDIELVLDICRGKAQALRYFEAKSGLVGFYQKTLETHMGFFTRAN